MLFKKAVLKNFAKCTGKQECQGLYFCKASNFEGAVLLKRDSDRFCRSNFL